MAVTLGSRDDVQSQKCGKRPVVLVIVFILLLVALIAGWKAFDLYLDYKAASDAYQNLASQYTRIDLDRAGGWDPSAQSLQQGDTQAENTEWRVVGTAGVDFPDLGVDHAALYELNPDYQGWIYIDDEIAGIQISYPFVQSADNSDYLKKTIEGEKSSAGSVFVDYNTPGDFSEHHTILYGHNMLDGSMFSNLKKYLGTADGNQERYFYIYLRDGSVLKCRLFSTHVISKNSTVYQINMSDKLYAEFFERVESESSDDWDGKSLIPDNIPEKTVTLSTCHGSSGTSRRMAVHAYIDTWYVDPDAKIAAISDTTVLDGADTGLSGEEVSDDAGEAGTGSETPLA